MGEDDILLPAAKVQRRYNVSHMWIERRLRDGSGFPAPLYIGRLRYWRLSEIQAWEERLPRENLARRRRA